MFIRRFLFSMTLLGLVLLSGCQNTVKGLGEDMQNTGKAIQKSVNGNN